MNKILLSALLAAAVACATSKSSSEPAAEAAAPPPAVTTENPPAAGDAPAAADGGVVNLKTGLPDPGLGPNAVLSLDQRGAFGPVVATHVDINSANVATCFRRRAMKPDERATLQLNAEQTAAIGKALARADVANATQVSRRGIIQDIGTVTLSLVHAGAPLTFVTDGSQNVNPPQSDITLLLNALTHQCLDGAAK